jgi:hypothetical protein
MKSTAKSIHNDESIRVSGQSSRGKERLFISNPGSRGPREGNFKIGVSSSSFAVLEFVRFSPLN